MMQVIYLALLVMQDVAPLQRQVPALPLQSSSLACTTTQSCVTQPSTLETLTER